MSNFSPGIEMRDRLLFDIWEPHEAIRDYPDDSVGAAVLKIFDEAFDLLVAEGQSPEEAKSGVQVIFGSGLYGENP